jgi:alpha-L-rhamnosidase
LVTALLTDLSQRKSTFLLAVGLALLACALVASPAPAATSPVTVTALRADQMTDPLGIDDSTPGLGWQLRSDRRGERQTAYRIEVADSAAQLESGPYVWDSGRVDSPESVDVPYSGPAPASAHRYVWRVQVWDGDGAVSAWSAPASWETGLLSTAAWQGAEWISPQAATSAANWTDYRLDIDFSVAAGAAGVVFRERDPEDFYMWQINIEGGEAVLRPHIQQNGSWTVLDEISLAGVISPANLNATHHLRIEVEGETITTSIDGQQVDVRDDPTFAGGGIGFRSGSSAEDASFSHLAVHDSGGSSLFSDEFATSPDPAFPGAEVGGGALRVRDEEVPLISTTPAVPLLRKPFTLAQPLAQVASARLYAYGLGFYEPRLSGAKVGDRVLAPPATSYDQRLRYQTYDATPQLREGENVLGLVLGEGYGPTFSSNSWRWLGPRQALALLEVTYKNGSHQRVVSDNSWRWSEGPIRSDSIYGGETYDARLSQEGWDEPGFAAGAWSPVQDVASPGGTLEADTTPPLRVVQTLRPLALTQPQPGVYVFDLGQNIAGWARLHVQGSAGETVRLRYAEDLGPDGRLDTFTNGHADATDTFVLGDTTAMQTFEPSFTYHGFRYVEVTGLSSPPTLDSLDGRVVHADMTPTASFSSSDPMLNRIYADNRWTMENNAMSYPTDNPVRDERTGPGMDIQAYADAAVRDFDADRFLAAYLQEAGVGGGSPDMHAPNVPLAWALYEQYGDRPALAAAYHGMTNAIDVYESEAENEIWLDVNADYTTGFGDWCPPAPASEAAGGAGGPEAAGYFACFSEVPLVNTALAYRDARIVAEAARALGHAADAVHYDEVADRIEAAFEARFATPSGYGSGRQVTSVLPLAFGMVPPGRRAAVGQGLVDRILDHDDGHLDTGIFGTRYLIDALVAAGRPDVALTVLDQRTYPGFGYEIGQGATTDWEEWVYHSSMETHDHAMFAGINASFLTELAGIEPTAPGYATIRIAPAIPDGLDHAAASLQTVRGEVASSWQRTGTELDLDVTVPPNAGAEVRVPTRPGDEVRESGLPAASSPGVSFVGDEGTTAVYDVGAGSYGFTAAPPAAAEPGGGGSGNPETGEGVSPGPEKTRLRIAARAVAHHRIALAIDCLAHCPSHPTEVRVTVRSPAPARELLARVHTRLGRHAHLTFHPSQGTMPPHLQVTVGGLGGGEVTVAVPLAGRRR